MGGLLALTMLPMGTQGCSRRRQAAPRVMILAIDAMDHGMVRDLMGQGRLPNFSALAREGVFMPLVTSMPPLSPVAWTNFITGMNPGGHGVFDFLRRTPGAVTDGFLPEDGISQMRASASASASERHIPLTSYVWPEQREHRLVRKGVPFWDILAAQGVPATIYKMPANFPVSDSPSRVLSGLGTPDIEGSYGTFSCFTDRAVDRDRHVTGGRGFPAAVEQGVVRIVDDDGRTTSPLLHGPVNPFLSKRLPLEERRQRVPFDVYVDATEKTAAICLQGNDVVLREGEWSSWLDVRFDLLPPAKSVHGIVRFLLQQAAPSFRLFASPVHLAPGTRGLATQGFDLHLRDKLGPYYTKGMSEETKGLTEGMLTPDEYLDQSDMVLNERLAALELLLSEFTSGVLFVYLSTLDLDAHVMWKHTDPKHPAHQTGSSGRHAGHIVGRYEKMDDVLGEVRSQLRPDDRLYVISDHGFAPFRREFNLVTWLQREGYLVYASPLKARLSTSYADIDWKRTRAYGVGFNGLFVNLQGREAEGAVAPAQRNRLVAEIRARLLEVRDVNGAAVFRSVYRPEDIYSGSELAAAPDLVLGYAAGCGPSDESVLGTWSEDEIADHMRGFSGHHFVDYELVPGVLFCNRKLTAARARLEDVTVTVLKDFGIDPAEQMTGEPLY